VERFLLDVFKVDPQDFMGRLEGYAIQGLKGNARVKTHPLLQAEDKLTGSARNAKARISAARTELRLDINAKLGEFMEFAAAC
jgi:hypothetical protein